MKDPIKLGHKLADYTAIIIVCLLIVLIARLSYLALIAL